MIDVSLRPKNESEMYSQTVLRLGLLNQHLRPLSPLFMLVQVQVLKKENFIIITQSENVFPFGHILLIQSGSQDTNAQTVSEVRQV